MLGGQRNKRYKVKVTEMTGIKFTHVVAFMTASTLVLQILLLYSSQCHISGKTDTEGKLQQFDKFDYSFTNPQTVKATTSSPKPVETLPPIKRRLTIGIPTIQRRDGNYFFEMLGSMFNKTSDEDLKEIVFVVFLADFNNTEWKSETEAEIRRHYEKYIASGSLQVIEAPKEFYSGMFHFEDKYMYWRTKQNYDYAYLMRYCEQLSYYYMQMEDDVQASDGYYSAINDFIEKQGNDDWVCLEFSELGFIGKLYHTRHIRKLSDMLLIFSHTQPVDFTYIYFNILLGSGPKRMRKPTLFQHLGFHSSLADKVQPLKDKYFEFPAKELNGDNPPAKIFTTLPINNDFPLNLPYDKGPGHFWAYGSPKENDTYTLIFDDAQLVRKFEVQTGSVVHPGDMIHNGVLEAGVSVSGNMETPVCEDLIVLGQFQNGTASVDADTVKAKLGVVKIRCLQIRITKAQTEWVIIKEIAVFLTKENII